MPETTENYHHIPNPSYTAAAFTDTVRTGTISDEKGIQARYSPLKSSGVWKVRTFLFDKGKWPTAEACQTWARDHKESFKGASPVSETIWTGEAGYMPRAAGSAPTDEELETINRHYALEPLAGEQVYVRTMKLTNDAWSSSHQIRLARGFQRSVMNSLPGKSLLLGHAETKDVPAVPEGRFFDSREVRDAEAGVTWGVADFYVVKTNANEHLRAQIDGGVFSYASIGMYLDERRCSLCGLDIMSNECPHIPGRQYPASEITAADTIPEVDDAGQAWCGMELRGQGQALEGSIVYLPELRGTQIVAEATLAARHGDFAEAKRLLVTSAGVIDPGTDGTVPDGIAGAAVTEQSGSLGAAATHEEGETMSAELEAIEAEKTVLTEKVGTLEARIGELEAAGTAQVAEVTRLEAAVAEAAPLRAAAIAELERLAGLVKRDAELDAFRSAFGADLSAMPAEKLLALTADWTKLVDATLSGGRQSTDAERDAATGEQKSANSAVTATAVRHIG